ncbi:hypothetical protein SAMN05216388_104914 [Halorientalis persicus]|jgi:hypothetical protein|uniref:Uncharacterized protein n=1 Tax=Halorientalis persicus TaxID=1367881 RepID=A0A1H8W5Q4_9EURY|nr:hypothetical protein SAMN05216388_104914 [Halorientalis persicus]
MAQAERSGSREENRDREEADRESEMPTPGGLRGLV